MYLMLLIRLLPLLWLVEQQSFKSEKKTLLLPHLLKQQGQRKLSYLVITLALFTRKEPQLLLLCLLLAFDHHISHC